MKKTKTDSSLKIIAGVDEAGKGPILGPLVMVALAVDEEGEQKLKWLGVKDSKLLSSEVREELFERIREIVLDFRIEVIEPDAIDLSVNDASSNLNWLEADTAARMVSELNPDKAIIDCPSPNIQAYKTYFSEKLDPAVRKKLELVMEHKADVNHIIVSAASVIAKVIRDRSVQHIKDEIGIDFGSGYLTDAKTQEFLHKHHDQYAHLFRKSWSPYKKVVQMKQQKKLDGY